MPNTTNINPEKLRELIKRLILDAGANLQVNFDLLDQAFTEQPPEPWKPEINQWYFYHEGSGDVCRELWTNDVVDQKRFAYGNCYPTEEACAAMRDQIKALGKK